MSSDNVRRRPRRRRLASVEPELVETGSETVPSAVDLERLRADVEQNRAAWNQWAPDHFVPGLRAWEAEEPVWGIWKTPESELHVLDDVGEGTDVIELGCGTAYACAWMARRGAAPVGIDVAESQLESARLFQKQFGLHFPLIRASADEVPFADGSFDLALSEYGASTWLPTDRWVREAARLLRPGGLLVFVISGSMLMSCTTDDGVAAGAELVRDYFGLERCEFPGDETVEYHLGHGECIKMLRANGLAVEELIEVRPPADATAQYGFVSTEWARRWPSEEVWKARKLG